MGPGPNWKTKQYKVTDKIYKLGHFCTVATLIKNKKRHMPLLPVKKATLLLQCFMQKNPGMFPRIEVVMMIKFPVFTEAPVY
jgi:hypothetical protein